MAEGTTMSSSSLGCLRLLVTICFIVSVLANNCRPGKECRLTVGSHATIIFFGGLGQLLEIGLVFRLGQGLISCYGRTKTSTLALILPQP